MRRPTHRWRNVTQDDSPTGTDVVEWRLSRARRWLPVLVLVFLATEAVLRLVRVVTDALATIGDYVLLVVTVLGTLAAAAMVVLARRARVRLGATAMEVRSRRRRSVPYDRITRVYRDRLTSGGATLLLADGTKVVLPAPVAGLGVGSPEVDAAVEQIRARLPTAGVST